MAAQSSFIQKIFYDISLEKRPELWQDDEDSEQKNIERIEFLATFDKTAYKPQLDKTKSSTRKNNMLAKALKEKGNKSYGVGDNIEAMNLYNQALCFSSCEPAGEYSVILANRSALWAELGEHELVETDIEHAIESGYPDKMLFKLYERRAKSRHALKKFDEALDDIEGAMKSLESSTLDAVKQKTKLKELNKLKDLISKENKAKPKNSTVEHSQKIQKPNFKEKNEKFPSFSDAVQIKYAEGRGRYAVANREIKVGELIAIENPYVSLVDKEFSKSHCWNCLLCTKSPIPCEFCSGVVYCSKECRQNADETYHKYECLYTDVLYQAHLGAWHLAFRALTSRPWSFYKENIEDYLNHNEKSGVGNDGVYKSEDVMSFNNLVTHNGVGGKQAPELMMQAHVVVFLIRLLTKLEYIKDPKPSSLDLDQEQVLVGRVLHHFMRAAFYNTHEITEIEKTGTKWENNKIQRIGRVTNPTLALINHACDPNYRRVSDGRTTYGFACKPIGKGKEISDLYCKPFASANLPDRQRYLQKYNFRCECVACANNWPDIDGLPSGFEGLPIKMYCQPANKIDAQVKRIKRAEDNFNKLSHKEDAFPSEVINSIVTVIEEVHKLVRQPHQMIVFWENQLHQALLHAHSAKVHTIKSGNSLVTWPLGM